MSLRVELLRDHFDAGTPDEVWLRKVGERGWVVLTKDQRIRRRQLEIEALLSAKLAAFVLTGGNLTGAAMAAAFVSAYPRMQRALRNFAVPFVAGVSASGGVTMLTDAVRHAAKKKGP